MNLKLYNFFKQTMLIICIFLTVACNTIEKKREKASLKLIVENCLGEKLRIPDSLAVYSPSSNYISDSLEISYANFKIYSHINASCPICLEDIKLWNRVSLEFYKYKIPIILIHTSKNNFELFKYKHEKGEIENFPYPFFFDLKSEFLKQNKFMKESSHFETVLTDRENSILLIGNPIHSKEIKDMYLNEIQKRIKDNE
ncbi:MAG: hypothetical protein K0B37_16520 [Bacteroidales bacterium]|nr:hypothetical protein [Bacteroidales bacterium]